MTKTRKQAEASGQSPKSLHGDDRAGSPLSGARRRSQSPKPAPSKPPVEQPSANKQPAATTANPSTSDGNPGTHVQDTAAVPPLLTSTVSDMETAQQAALEDALSTPVSTPVKDTTKIPTRQTMVTSTFGYDLEVQIRSETDSGLVVDASLVVRLKC